MQHEASHPEVSTTLFWRILEHSHEGIALADPADGLILWHNAAFQAACSSAGDLRGKSLDAVLPNWTGRQPDQPGGAGLWVIEEPTVTAVLVRTMGTEPLAVSRDSLTGLADRGQLEQRLNWWWGLSTAASERPLAAMFIDLNDFKRINDDWGHRIGDEALRQVARRLQAALRADDFLARYGGDEFVVLLTGWQRPDDLQPVVRRLHDSMKVPLQLDGHLVVVSASIGVAYSTDGHPSPEALLHAADRAMYASKQTQ